MLDVFFSSGCLIDERSREYGYSSRGVNSLKAFHCTNGSFWVEMERLRGERYIGLKRW